MIFIDSSFLFLSLLYHTANRHLRLTAHFILIYDGVFTDIKRIINKKLDIAIGSRNLIKNGRKGLSLIRYLASILIIFIFNFFLGKKTADPMTGYFIFKKKILNQVYNKLYGKGFKILSDIIYSTNNDYKIEDVDINFKLRKKGGSKMNLKILQNC